MVRSSGRWTTPLCAVIDVALRDGDWDACRRRIRRLINRPQPAWDAIVARIVADVEEFAGGQPWTARVRRANDRYCRYVNLVEPVIARGRG